MGGRRRPPHRRLGW